MNDKIKILVVDDEEKIREGCHRILTNRGYDVFTAENGQAALDLLTEEEIDIILLDLKMPGMDGEEVLELTHAKYPAIPVIIITGHGIIDTAVECMKKGAYDFITKPFEMHQFMLPVTRAADKRRLEQKARQFQQETIRNLYDLNLEKSRMKTIINCLANGVMVTNRNLEVVLYNPALTRLLGITDEIQTPVPLARITKDEFLLETLKKIQSRFDSTEEFISQEIVVENRTLRSISAPALGPDGDIAGTVTVLEDITPFKQLDQMKTDFVNMVAHELRSPLVSIRQLVSVMLEGMCGPLEDKQREYLTKSTKKIDGLLELIQDLLDMARLEAGMTVQHQVPLDLEPLIQSMIDIMDVRAKGKGITFNCSCKNLLPVHADQKSIEEVFDNLLSNAINYSPDGGHIRVTAERLGNAVEITVSDTGVGIPPEELPKIFDKFYRVKHPKTREVIGTGLGLSLVQSIIEAHHGTIEVESREGEGTAFRILLPVMK
ncbi:MAG: response regulator [Deltaproteobacteria bacterium]|nr:response regulator [Deltaproteobacteria bacterium]MBW2085497.1 response regulator [Deltaproteobacteria bacterium]